MYQDLLRTVSFLTKAGVLPSQTAILILGINENIPSDISYEYLYVYTVTCQKFKYNFTHFKDFHVIFAICHTVYSKDSLFSSLKIAVIKQSRFER